MISPTRHSGIPPPRRRASCATACSPPAIDVRHIAAVRESVAERLAHLRGLLRRGAFSFDEAVRGADRMTVAVTLFALLELYKRGEASWEQPESFGEIAVRSCRPQPAPLAAAGGVHG